MYRHPQVHSRDRASAPPPSRSARSLPACGPRTSPTPTAKRTRRWTTRTTTEPTPNAAHAPAPATTSVAALAKSRTSPLPNFPTSAPYLYPAGHPKPCGAHQPRAVTSTRENPLMNAFGFRRADVQAPPPRRDAQQPPPYCSRTPGTCNAPCPTTLMKALSALQERPGLPFTRDCPRALRTVLRMDVARQHNRARFIELHATSNSRTVW